MATRVESASNVEDLCQLDPEENCFENEPLRGWHRNRSVRWPKSILGRWLPAYSPELNPAEHWFRGLCDRLANPRTSKAVETIDRALTEAFHPYWEQPDLPARLTGYHWRIAPLDGTPHHEPESVLAVL